MRKISGEKHVKKNGSGPKKPKSAHFTQETRSATAVELASITHLDDAALRRLGNSINPLTQSPWIPKPSKGLYQVEPTIAGALAWWHHQATRDVPDHPVFADMREAETRGLIPREFQKYAKGKGIDFINLNRSIKSEPLRRLAFEILKKVFAGGCPELVTEIEGVEALDSDAELAKLRREQRREIARENAEAEQRIHSKERIEEVLWQNALAPLRAGLLNLRKTAFAQIEGELDRAEVSAEARAEVKTILIAAVDGLLAQIRRAFPSRHE